MLLLLFLLLTLLFLSLKGLILGQRSRGFSVHSAIRFISTSAYVLSMIILATPPHDWLRFAYVVISCSELAEGLVRLYTIVDPYYLVWMS